MLLNKNEIKKKLSSTSGWNYENNALVKEFGTRNFVDAVSLIVKIAFEAEKMDHHPDINLHSYNKLKIILTTHNENGVTENDIKLAEIIEKLS